MPSTSEANSSAGLREAFSEFYRPTRDELSDMIRRGLIVLDTNTLLDLYRFTVGARTELLGALTQIGDRLWIPHRVALEFYRGRVGVIADRTTAPLEIVADLEKIEESTLSKIGSFGNRFGLGVDTLKELTGEIKKAFQFTKNSMREVHESYDLSLARLDDDPVIQALEILLHGRIGKRPTDEDLALARKEAERRTKEGIPPGYRDASKDKERAAGDCLWWLELIKEATDRKLPVILVTNDSKDDFIHRVHGQTIGPRPELKEELSRKAGVPFHILNTRGLLLNARELLNADVSDSTLAETAAAETSREPATKAAVNEAGEDLDKWVASRYREPEPVNITREDFTRRTTAIVDCFPSELHEFLKFRGDGTSIRLFVSKDDFDAAAIPKSVIAGLLATAGRYEFLLSISRSDYTGPRLVIYPWAEWHVDPRRGRGRPTVT